MIAIIILYFFGVFITAIWLTVTDYFNEWPMIFIIPAFWFIYWTILLGAIVGNTLNKLRRTLKRRA